MKPRVLGWFVLAGIAAYVVIDVVLKFLRPEYSLIHNAESDYGRGSWFWVMDINFLLRCALSLALVRALSKAVAADTRLRGGLILLTIWAVASGLLAFFADDIEGQRLHGSGFVHVALALIAFISVTIGTVVISVVLREDPAWRAPSSVLTVLSSLGVVAFLLMGVAIRHRHGPGGLYERIFLGIELLWMAVSAGWIARRRRDPEIPGARR